MGDVPASVRPQVYFPRWLRGLVLAVSALSFVLGVVALFSTSNDAGTAALLAAAVALLALGTFADRISTVEAAGMKLELLAADQLARADVAAQEGRDVEAAQLRESAMTLLAAARPVSSNLEMIRRTMPSSWERTAVLEKVMHQARGLANAVTSAQEVRRLFDTGTDGDRVSAIDIMQARPEFADLGCLTAAVTRSRSAFEQYQALRAVDEAVSRLPQDSALRTELLTMVADALARDTLLRDSSDRRHLAERILRAERM